MKKIFINLSFIMAAALCVVSCSDALVDDAKAVGGEESFTLTVAAPGADTRVSFVDNDSEGLKLTWEVGDKFDVYASSNNLNCDTFTCSAVDVDGTATFGSNTVLTTGNSYTAIYPAASSYVEELANVTTYTTTQQITDINSLDDYCYMKSEFTYSAVSDIVFKHQCAVMTIKFSSYYTPEKVTVSGDGGFATYTAEYDGTASPDVDGGYNYTWHIMFEPITREAEETLTFTITDSEGNEQIRSATTSKSHLAGVRYTADVSNMTASAWLGDGGETTPYLITDGGDLRLLSTKVNAATTYGSTYFKMTQDIDLGGESNAFTPIGREYDATFFAGSFDGNYNEVSGLYVNTTINAALFGVIQDSATIQNLGVDGTVIGTEYAAGIIGRFEEGTINIINCYNKAKVTGTENVGGITGGSYQNSSVDNGGSTYLFEGCYNEGAITATSTTGGSVGGIVGMTRGGISMKITDCYNTGDIESSTTNYAGGILGISGTTTSATYLTNCYNTGAITNGGGIAGSDTSGLIFTENCFYLNTSATNDVTSASSCDADYMTDPDDLLSKLNAQGTNVTWVAGSDGYPIQSWQE